MPAPSFLSGLLANDRRNSIGEGGFRLLVYRGYYFDLVALPSIIVPHGPPS